MNKKRISVFALVLIVVIIFGMKSGYLSKVGVNLNKSVPVPMELTVDPVSGESSIMSWKTEKPTMTELYYGTAPISSAEKKMVVKDYTPSTKHTIEITHLQPKIKYYFRIVSMVEKDGSNSVIEG